MPLSETVKFQSGSATRYETTIAASRLASAKACFRAFITSSVTINPMLTTSREGALPRSDFTVSEIGRLSPIIDCAERFAQLGEIVGDFDRLIAARELKVLLNSGHGENAPMGILQLQSVFPPIERSAP